MAEDDAKRKRTLQEAEQSRLITIQDENMLEKLNEIKLNNEKIVLAKVYIYIYI